MTTASRLKGLTRDPNIVYFDIIVADGFVLTEVAAVVDLVRIANRASGHQRFEWTYRSESGGLVTSLCRVQVDTEQFSDRPLADYAVFVGNSNDSDASVYYPHLLARYTYGKTQIILLAEAASRYIAERGKDENVFTTHWENLKQLQEANGIFNVKATIAADSGQIITCAGMLATLDLMLVIIGRHVPALVTRAVAEIMLHQKIRDFDAPQLFTCSSINNVGDAALDACINYMRTNIEEPLPISELARLTEMSSRTMERKFREFLNTTPNAYYRELRLNMANNLLWNTDMSVNEISLACGFSTGFSAQFKKMFGVLPKEVRKR